MKNCDSTAATGWYCADDGRKAETPHTPAEDTCLS